VVRERFALATLVHFRYRFCRALEHYASSLVTFPTPTFRRELFTFCQRRVAQDPEDTYPWRDVTKLGGRGRAALERIEEWSPMILLLIVICMYKIDVYILDF
jgi:hypothetical protein